MQSMLTTPLDIVAASQTGTLLAGLRHAVGGHHVLASADDVARYSRCTIPWDRRCAAVVLPANTEEVRTVVRVARQFSQPLWTFSRGHNWGYGTTCALREGAIILLLERLNRILEVNAELAYAVVEPGVSQKQLNDYLREHAPSLWTDCTDSTPDGSVIGNALERGRGYTPYGDHFGALCGMEVVLPSGELFRTGGWAEPAQTWHTYKWGVGPFLDGLFSQSNLGIVTRAGVWLMPAPEACNAFVFEIADADRLPAAVDATRRLALHRTISNIHCFNDFMFFTSLLPYPYAQREGRTHLSTDARLDLSRRYGLSPWTMIGGVYGTAAQVRAHRAFIRRELGPFGRIQFMGDRKMALLSGMLRLFRRTQRMPIVRPVLHFLKRLFFSHQPLEVLEAWPKVYPLLKGVPGDHIVRSAYFKRRRGPATEDIDPARDRCGLSWFAPVVPATGAHVEGARRECARLYEAHGFEFPLSLIQVDPRSLVLCMAIYYDRDDAEETARAQELYEALVEATERLGYPQYRTSVAGMGQVLHGEAAPVLGAIKQALDPDGVLAPGHYGMA